MKMIFFISLIILLVNMGCEKEPVGNPSSPSISIFPPPPNVSAGAYIELIYPADSCILSGIVTTIGSNVKSYLWEKVYGPASFKIDHPDSLITKVRALHEGSYMFQLTVTDSNGLTGKATMNVSVITIATFEYSLDLDIQTGYSFYDNTEICPFDCSYIDITVIEGSVHLSPKNDLNVYIYEQTDSAAQAYDVNYGFTSFYLSDKYAGGPSSFKLEKIILQGDGTFNGTIQLNSSSALGTWREDAFNALPPLTVTGKLDTTTHTVNMQIKGKIIF